MKSEQWGKAILAAYRNLEPICNILDDLVLKKGVKSREAGFDTDGTIKVMEGMIELTERKIKFINLKLIIENTIKVMEENISKYLVFRFMDCFSYQTIAKMTDSSLRTAQRRVAKALTKFGHTLKSLGFGGAYLEEKYGNEPLILGVLDQFSKDKRLAKPTERNVKLKTDAVFFSPRMSMNSYIEI